MIRNTSLFKNLLYTPGVLFTLLRNLNRQKGFLEKYLSPELADAKENNDGSLDMEDFRKITGYYGLAVPAILGEALCVLRGMKMSLRERLALTYQGAMTGLGDDFFDKKGMSDSLVKAMIENPDALTGNNSGERLFLSFYRKSLLHAYDPTRTLNYLRRVFEAQKESRKQGIPGLLKNDELVQITIQKGATSVLFYRTVLVNPPSEAEEEAIYQIGGLMQLGNDIFDVYKDCLKKIDTPVTTSKSVSALRQLFQSQMTRSFTLFYSTGYSRKNINSFLRLISMGFCSRCFVCLDQLEKKENETKLDFSPCQYDRKDLVCDMEKTGNKWRTILKYIR